MAQYDSGIGHKLRAFLPVSRHATFRIQLTIHDVTNIPFQSGSFALEWKFKNARANNGHQSRPSTPSEQPRPQLRNGAQATAGDSETEAGRSSVDESYRRYTTAEKGKGKETILVVDSSTSVASTPNGSVETTAASSTTTHGTRYGQFLSPATLPVTNGTRTPPPKPPPLLGPLPVVRVDDAHKGSTHYVPLHDHTVRWDHTVEVVVHFKLKRDSHELLPCELRLILQEHFAGPTSVEALTPNRFGVVNLNLAEYADRGPITRRYLLDESGTNARVKLTIESSFIGGDKNYKVPELTRGQAVAGVIGVLSNDTLRPLLNPSTTALSTSSIPTPSRSNTPLSNSLTDLTTQRPPIDRGKSSFGSARALQRFIVDHSQHSAESVIEAIFNPIPTTNTTPSPFTYHSSSPNASFASIGFLPSSLGRGSRVPRPSITATTRTNTIETSTTTTSVDERSSRDDSHDEASESLDHSVEFGRDSSTAASTTPSVASSTSGKGLGWFKRKSSKAPPPNGRLATASTSYKALSSRGGVAGTSDLLRVPLPPPPLERGQSESST